MLTALSNKSNTSNTSNTKQYLERQPKLCLEPISACFQIQPFLFLYHPTWSTISSYLPWHCILVFSLFQWSLLPPSPLLALLCLNSKCWNAPDLWSSPLSYPVSIFFPHSEKGNQCHYSFSHHQIAFSANTYHSLILSYLGIHAFTHTNKHIYTYTYMICLYYCFNFISFSLIGYKL